MAQYTINFSTNASATMRELDRVIAAVAKVEKAGRGVVISLDTSKLSAGLSTTFKQLDREIEKVQRKLNRLQIGSGAFRGAQAALGFREGQRERGELIGQPLRLRGQAQAFEQGSLIRLEKELRALQVEASQIKPNSQEWAGFQQQIARIQSELKQADRAAEAIRLREDFSTAAIGSLDRLDARLRLLQTRARSISPNLGEWKELNREIQKTEQSIAKLTRKPLTLGQRAGAAGGAFLYGGGLGGGFGSAALGIAGGLAGGVPGAFAGAAVGQLVDNLQQQAAAVAKLSAEYNKSKIALAGVSSDQEDYNKAITAASSASRRFLLPLTDATRQFTKLQASVRGAGYDTDTTIKAFNGIASAIVATGGSTEDLNGALLATSQVFSKGKVSAEELRQQIGERLAGAFTIFADSSGIAAKELDKLLSKGEVTLDDFIGFLGELNKRYGETTEILAKAPENAGPRLKVALEAASLTFGSFFQVVGAGFQSYFTDLVNFALNNEKAIKRAVTVLAIGFRELSRLVVAFGKFLVDTFNAAFTSILGGLDLVMQRAEAAINRFKEVQSLTPGRIRELQDRAQRATEDKFGLKILGRTTGIIADQEQASRFYNETFNNLIDAATNASQKTKYTDKVRNILFPDFKPGAFGSGLGAERPEGADADGAESGSTKKLQNYIESRIGLLGQLAQFEQNRIALMTGLSNEEMSVMQALARFRASNAINDRQYFEDQREAANYSIETRDLYLSQIRERYQKERQLIQQQLELDIYTPLLNLERQLIDENYELAASLKAMSEGRTELTAVEKAGLSIAKQVEAAKKEGLTIDPQIIDNILKQAAAQDEFNKQLQKTLYLIELGNREAMAGALTPADELRTQIAQRLPLASPEEREEVFQREQIVQQAEKIKQDLQGIASSIGDAFGQAFKGIITGTSSVREALAGMFQSIADSFADMVSQMISQWLRTQVLQGLQSLFGPAMGALGSFGGGASIGQAVSMPTGVGMGAGGGILQNSTGQGFGTLGPNFGIRQFANGGVVSGPTLGLVGEGRYNEAVVPLPDGKSIPVELGGGAGNISTNIVVNVSNGQANSQTSGLQGNQLARELEGAVRQVILKEVRPGGIIYSNNR
jgi:tape measure domain-containing protein